MKQIKDFNWKPEMSLKEAVESFSSLGYQASELYEASKVILKMKREGAKIFLTFTSNMASSGLSGFFAQLCKLHVPDVLVTTSGAIEEDIMKALGEKFELRGFNADDVELHEKGENRIGNLVIKNHSYMKFEDLMSKLLKRIYDKSKRITVSELLREIGLMLEYYSDSPEGLENSILYQAAKNDIPIYCPGIADSSFGFQLFMFQQKHDDFVVDVIKDMKRTVTDLNFDDKKGLISLGGSISKHYAIFSALLSGGFDYSVYLTTSSSGSGSMSGATTKEAKSWGKIKDDGQAATVKGDVTITFPLVMSYVLDKLNEEGFILNEPSESSEHSEETREQKND